VFRTQIVDFTDSSMFNQNVGTLITGLKNIYLVKPATEKKIDNKSKLKTSTGGDDTHHKKDTKIQKFSLYFSYDSSDPISVVVREKIIKAVKTSTTFEIDDDSASEKQISSIITNCWIFITILSPNSMQNTKLRDQLALAENHNKLILPVITEAEIKLDPAMLYTLAKAPKFLISSNDDDTTIDTLNLLIHYLLMNEKMIKAAEHASELTKEIEEIKENTEQTDELLIKIKTKLHLM